MQHRDVVGIDHILEMLQPVAGNDGRSAAADRGVVGFDELAIVHFFQCLIARQHRLFLRWAHIGEDQPVEFQDRVPGLAHLVIELAAVGFAGLLKAAALGVELPAVIATTDTVLFDLAVIKRGAAVAAARMKQSGAAMTVAKQDEILTQRADFTGNIGGVSRETNRVPIAPQQFAHRRTPTDLGQFRSGCGGPHGVGGAEIAIPLADVHRGFLRIHSLSALVLISIKVDITAGSQCCNKCGASLLCPVPSMGIVAGGSMEPEFPELSHARAGVRRPVKIACLAPFVALR